MDETLMTYLRNIIHWSRRYMLRRVDDVPEMMKRTAKPRREAGQKTESSRSVLAAAAAVVLRMDV